MRSLASLAVAILGAAAAVAVAEPVRIVNIGHNYYAAPLYIAQSEKLFQKHGLEPTVTVVQGGPLALQAVMSGDADLGLLSYEHVLQAAVQGKQVVSFFNLVARPGSNVIASNAMMDAMKGKTVAERVAALKGKRVGVPSQGGSGDKLAQALIETQGMKPADIRMVFSGSDSGAYVAALKRDLIDVAFVAEPTGLMVKEAGAGGMYLSFTAGEIPGFNDMIYMSLATTPEALARKRELMTKVTAVFADAQRILKSDPERAIAIMKKEYPEMSDKMNRDVFALMSPAWSADGRMTVAQAKATADYLKPTGPHALDFPKTFSNDYLPK